MKSIVPHQVISVLSGTYILSPFLCSQTHYLQEAMAALSPQTKREKEAGVTASIISMRERFHLQMALRQKEQIDLCHVNDESEIRSAIITDMQQK